MKRKFLLLLVTVALVLCSTNAIFAQEVDNTSMSSGEYATIPIFDSVTEAEQALEQKDAIQTFGAGDEGGTQTCFISPYIVRTNSLMSKCTLYLHYESNFRIESLRFKELIVEKSYLIGKNYLKLPKSGSSYYTVKLNSDYRGYKTIETFEIPTGIKSVVVRTKSLGIYRNSTSSWLACQYQIGGTWVIESDRPF